MDASADGGDGGLTLERRLAKVGGAYILALCLNIAIGGRPLLAPFTITLLAVTVWQRLLPVAPSAVVRRRLELAAAVGLGAALACAATWITPITSVAWTAALVLVAAGQALYCWALEGWFDDGAGSPAAARYRKARWAATAAGLVAIAWIATLLATADRVAGAAFGTDPGRLFGRPTDGTPSEVAFAVLLVTFLASTVLLGRAASYARAGLRTAAKETPAPTPAD